MHFQVSEIAKNWSLAEPKQARKQAVSLLRAKKYLNQRGLSAHKVDSDFAYSAGPTVLTGANHK